jgi:hypothetical protein
VALGRNAAVQETAALISKTGGSINEVGWCFQPFRINDLELVAQIFTSWNPLTSWVRLIERYRIAA